MLGDLGETSWRQGILVGSIFSGSMNKTSTGNFSEPDLERIVK